MKAQDLFKQRNISPAATFERDKKFQESLEKNFKPAKFENF